MGLFDFLRKKEPAQKSADRPQKPEESMPPELANKADQVLLAQFATTEDFPFPVQTLSGERAESVLLRLRSLLSDTGAWPVILGESGSADRLFEMWDEPYDYQKELGTSEFLDLEKWFEKQREEQEECRDEESPDQMEIHQAGTAPMKTLQAGFNHHGHPHPKVVIALVPAIEAWEIPLHLHYGDWNSCPEPHVHAALARRWQEQYGAVMATVSADVIEFTVARPPATDQEALALAWEQYFYCCDIVDQGVGSVATLAQALRRSTRWFFWWD